MSEFKSYEVDWKEFTANKKLSQFFDREDPEEEEVL